MDERTISLFSMLPDSGQDGTSRVQSGEELLLPCSSELLHNTLREQSEMEGGIGVDPSRATPLSDPSHVSNPHLSFAYALSGSCFIFPSASLALDASFGPSSSSSKSCVGSASPSSASCLTLQHHRNRPCDVRSVDMDPGSAHRPKKGKKEERGKAVERQGASSLKNKRMDCPSHRFIHAVASVVVRIGVTHVRLGTGGTTDTYME